MLKTKALVLFLNLLLFNLIIAKYVKNRNDEIVKFIDFEGQSFFRNKTVNGKSELVCDESTEEGLCENFKLDAVKCKNKNYKKEQTVDWHCEYPTINDEVVVKDYNIDCDQIDQYSFKKGTCIFEYKLKVNPDKEPPEIRKDTDPLIIVIYIIGSISALVLLTLVMFFSYKLINKYRTRKFSVYN